MTQGRVAQISWHRGDSEAMLGRLYRAEREPGIRTRLHWLWLVRQGSSLVDAARMVGVADRSGRRWIATYRLGGLKALRARRTNRYQAPSKLNDAQWELLRSHLRLGTSRTGAQIARWILKTFSVSYSLNGLYRALRQHRIRIKVPRPRHVKADRAAQEAWKKGGSPPRSSSHSPR